MIQYQQPDVNFKLEGKTFIVTGGAAGIGLAAAKFFAEKGANCVLVDLNQSCADVAGTLGKNHMGMSGNILDKVFRQSVIDAAVKRFGRADMLLNSAGIVALEKAELVSEEEWDRVIGVNLTGSFRMAQTFGSYLIGAGLPGVIINMASQAGTVALDRHVAYCASKGAIITMTKVLAFEWGKYGIRVNCVSPTVVLTELGHAAWDGPVGEAFKKEIPAGRFAEPEEIAAAVAFLCSDGASMITGHNLIIDGGYTIK